ANALLVGERRNRITPADAARFLAILAAFPITVDDQTVAHAWGDTMHLARAHKLSSYDASYLELAIRLGLPLTAQDGKLKTARACRSSKPHRLTTTTIPSGSPARPRNPSGQLLSCR